MIRRTILLTLLGALSAPAAALAEPPQIEIWTDQRGSYHYGDHARVYFRTTQDGYVTVLHVDTDGRVHVLFPRYPTDDNFARGGYQHLAAADDGGYGFAVGRARGTGYVVGVVRREPFEYHPYARNGNWEYRRFARNGYVRGDPQDAVRSIVHELVGGDEPSGYAYDVQPYQVEAKGRSRVVVSWGVGYGTPPYGGHDHRYGRGHGHGHSRYGHGSYGHGRHPYYGGRHSPYYGGYYGRRGRFRFRIGLGRHH